MRDVSDHLSTSSCHSLSGSSYGSSPFNILSFSRYRSFEGLSSTLAKYPGRRACSFLEAMIATAIVSVLSCARMRKFSTPTWPPRKLTTPTARGLYRSFHIFHVIMKHYVLTLAMIEFCWNNSMYAMLPEKYVLGQETRSAQGSPALPWMVSSACFLEHHCIAANFSEWFEG